MYKRQQKPPIVAAETTLNSLLMRRPLSRGGICSGRNIESNPRGGCGKGNAELGTKTVMIWSFLDSVHTIQRPTVIGLED